MLRTILVLASSLLVLHAEGLTKLEALSMIESGDDDRAVGSAGEVSRYQIMPNVWKSYTSSTAYRNQGVSTKIAQQHLEYLEGYFRKRTGRDPSDFDRYVMWNAGPVYYSKIAFTPRRVHPLIRERANRFVNLREADNSPRVASAR